MEAIDKLLGDPDCRVYFRMQVEGIPNNDDGRIWRDNLIRHIAQARREAFERTREAAASESYEIADRHAKMEQDYADRQHPSEVYARFRSMGADDCAKAIRALKFEDVFPPAEGE